MLPATLSHQKAKRTERVKIQRVKIQPKRSAGVEIFMKLPGGEVLYTILEVQLTLWRVAEHEPHLKVRKLKLNG